jgi:predicted DNA-binding transcriptional regulator YafY
MSDSGKETLLRQWQMLRLIPRYPFKITSKELHKKLLAENYVTTKRTVERDLLALSVSFPIMSDESGRTYRWSWSKDGATFDLPGISNTEALTFNMVEQYLKPILPASTLGQLQPYFTTAEKKLAALSLHSSNRSWVDKVRVIQPSQALLPPNIDPEVQREVYEALLRDKKLYITYKKSGADEAKKYEVNPLGIVERGQVIYVVCTIAEYQEPRQLVLHRIVKAEMLDEPSKRPEGFELSSYIEQAFGFGGNKPIKLEVIFRQTNFTHPIDHLRETPLSADQKITQHSIEENSFKLTATVIDSLQLRWWLMGFGEGVEVLGPPVLREAISKTVNGMARFYQDDGLPDHTSSNNVCID